MVDQKNQPTPDIMTDRLMDPGQIEQIWEQRAQNLAQVEMVEAPGEMIEVVLVLLGDELLGIEVPYVSDIRLPQPLVRVPRTPEWVAGVIHLRGRIYSVIDLRLFLDLPPAQNPGEGLLLTVQNPAMQVIFFVDDVPGVESVQPKGMLSKDSGLHHLPAGYVRAVIERQGNRSRQPYITLLDMAALLSDPQLRIDQEQG